MQAKLFICALHCVQARSRQPTITPLHILKTIRIVEFLIKFSFRTLRVKMSFKIQEAFKWQEEICLGKLDLFERIVTIGNSPGLKFSVNFKRTKKNDPKMEIKLIEGATVLNEPVVIVLEYKSEDDSSLWHFNSSVGCNVKSLNEGYSCPRFHSVERFRKSTCND